MKAILQTGVVVLFLLASLAVGARLQRLSAASNGVDDDERAGWASVQEKPETAAAWVALAQAQASHQHLRAAELSYKTALEIAPDLDNARVRLGYVLYELGRDQEAAAAIEEGSKNGADGWAALTLSAMRAQVETTEGFPRIVLEDIAKRREAAQKRAQQDRADEDAAMRKWVQHEQQQRQEAEKARLLAQKETAALRQAMARPPARSPEVVPADDVPEPEPTAIPEVPSERCSVKLTRRGSHGTYRIQARLDNEEASLIFDTGASLSVISKEMAKRVGVTTDDRPIVARTASGLVRFQTGLIDRVEVDGLVTENVRVAICDGCETAQTDGLLGLDVQRALGLVLDPASKRAVYPCE